MRTPRLRSAAGAAVLTLSLAAVPGVGVAVAADSVPGPVEVAAEPAATKLSHGDAASRFQSSSITWSSTGGCSDRNTSTCTSFEQINLATVQGAQTLKSASGCAVHITGGTETGHAGGTYSHWNGYKLDFRPTSCLNNYVTGTFTYIGERGDGAALYESASGNVYAREGNHWDVTFHNCGGC